MGALNYLKVPPSDLLCDMHDLNIVCSKLMKRWKRKRGDVDDVILNLNEWSQASTTRTRHVAHWGEFDRLWHVLRHRAYAKTEANTYFGMSITHQTKLMRSLPMRLCLNLAFYPTMGHIRLQQYHHQPLLPRQSNVMQNPFINQRKSFHFWFLFFVFSMVVYKVQTAGLS